MSDMPIAIQTRSLCKDFRLYNHPLDAIREFFTGKERHVKRHALKNINLELRRGEIVGILGRNGAGKSTLLKIIAGTLSRTRGDLEINGRITAILELGTGFHPEYTGRENIYMGGFCLGMSRKEIESKIESIIDFSELREYIDQPFKSYSTGMQTRLTFSTAISVDPDILIVDEALSVGDAKFQYKCFSRLQQLREKRTTILMVSHDMNTITAICDRAILLEAGQVLEDGDPKEVSSSYMGLLFGDEKVKNRLIPNAARVDLEADLKNNVTAEDNFSARQPEGPRKRYGSGEATILDWGLLNENGQRVSVIESGKPCEFFMEVRFETNIIDFSGGFGIKDRRGIVLWGVTNISQYNFSYSGVKGEILRLSCKCLMHLAAGEYFVNFGIGHVSDGSMADFAEDALIFKVVGSPGFFTTSLVDMQGHFKMVSDKSAIATKVNANELTPLSE